MSEELKQCPFCGSKNLQYVEKNPESYEQCYYVYCLNCDAQGPEYISIDDAISAWNRRS